MTMPSSSHSGFKRKGLVPGVPAPGQPTRWTCPSQAPPGLQKDATVWKETSQAHKRGLKADLEAPSLCLPETEVRDRQMSYCSPTQCGSAQQSCTRRALQASLATMCSVQMIFLSCSLPLQLCDLLPRHLQDFFLIRKKNLISLIPVLNFEGAVMDHSSYFSFSADTPRNSLHSLDDHRPGVLTPASREQSRLTCTPCCSCQPPDAWADPHTCKGSNRSQAPGPHRGI